MDYVAMKDGLIKRMLTKFGASMVVRIFSVANTSLNVPVSVGSTEHTVTAVFASSFKQGESVNGVYPVPGDTKAYIWFSDNTVPNPGDLLIDPAGVENRIEASEAIDPIKSGTLIVKVLIRNG